MTISAGELVGLVCALIWALNGVITRTQSYKVPPALMNAIRCGTAGVCFWIALGLTSSTAVYGLLSGKEWGLLIGSVVIGVTIGDTLYLWSIREIGISRTMALVGVVPLTTLFFEHVLLDQPFPARFVLGCFLVVGGAICLTLKSRAEKQENTVGRLWVGVLLSLTAAVLWGVSTVMIKPAIAQLTPIEANAFVCRSLHSFCSVPIGLRGGECRAALGGCISENDCDRGYDGCTGYGAGVLFLSVVDRYDRAGQDRRSGLGRACIRTDYGRFVFEGTA